MSTSWANRLFRMIHEQQDSKGRTSYADLGLLLFDTRLRRGHDPVTEHYLCRNTVSLVQTRSLLL